MKNTGLKKFFKLLIYTVLLLTLQNSYALTTIEPLSKQSKESMISKEIWKTSCPVKLERLRKITFSYYDFNDIEYHNGEVIVFDVVASQVVKIFQDLHAIHFPIKQAHPIDEYNGDDAASMVANNTSCFNYREITGGGFVSMHGYGCAIDINPLQNPCISFDKTNEVNVTSHILPNSGYVYLNRNNQRPGMSEAIVALFAQYGFKVWGGNWNDPIDWQHFQPSKPMVWLLAEMNYNDGKFFFNAYVKGSKLLDNITDEDKNLILLYKKNRVKFMKIFKSHPELFNLEPQAAYDKLWTCL